MTSPKELGPTAIRHGAGMVGVPGCAPSPCCARSSSQGEAQSSPVIPGMLQATSVSAFQHSSGGTGGSPKILSHQKGPEKVPLTELSVESNVEHHATIPSKYSKLTLLLYGQPLKKEICATVKGIFLLGTTTGKTTAPLTRGECIAPSTAAPSMWYAKDTDSKKRPGLVLGAFNSRSSLT